MKNRVGEGGVPVWKRREMMSGDAFFMFFVLKRHKKPLVMPLPDGRKDLMRG